MKKFVTFIAIVIVVLVAGFLILALIEPTNITVTRTIVIKAPKEAVFEQMVKFKNWPNWSPFYELDTTARYTYSGTDGQEASSYSWESKKEDVGSGSMTNTGVKGTHFDFHIDFEKPWKSTATGYLQATDSAGFTKATWSFSTHMSFPMNALQAFPFMDMRKMLGSSFEHGLEKMKQYTENHAAAAPANPFADVDVKEVDFPAHTYVGVHQTVNWADMLKFFADTYAMLEIEAGPKANGPASGLFFTWDTVKKNSDMAAVLPVSDTSKHIMGTSVIKVDAAKAFMTVEKGGYSRSMKYHGALAMKVAASGRQQSLVIEEYIAGPKNEPDSNKWVTNIYYLVK